MDATIIELSNLAREDGQRYTRRRAVFDETLKHCGETTFVALVGPRGVGKTVVMKQLLNTRPNSLYISLDMVRPGRDLFTIAQEAIGQGVKILLLDEVHYYAGFALELKKIYDLLRIQIVCTSSSAIELHDSAFDLSRRLRVVTVPPFLFREFLLFEKGLETPALSLEDLYSEDISRDRYGQLIHEEPLFTQYLQGRNYPFTLETSDWMGMFGAMLDTIIHKDLVLTGRVTPEEAIHLRRICEFIGKSPSEGISYSSCAANCGFSTYRAQKYTDILEKAFILTRLFPKGTGVTREPKIQMALPYRLLFKPYDDCIGSLREDFFVETMRHLGYQCNYLKSKRGSKMPDYALGDTVFEIGGSSKGTRQFKGFKEKRRLLLVQPGRIDALRRPLMHIGLLGVSQRP